MAWVIKENEEFFLYNPVQKVWVGQPIQRYASVLGQWEWIWQYSKEIKDALPLKIEFVPGSDPPIEIGDQVRIWVPDEETKSRRYMYSVGLEGSGIIDNPPLWVMWRPLSTENADRFSWTFVSVNDEYYGQSQFPATYGIPYGIMNSRNQEYVKLSDLTDTKDIVIDAQPSTDYIETWVLVPAYKLYRCANKEMRQCYFTEGPQNILILPRCDAPDGPCYNDENDQMYHTEQECLSACFLPRYVCTGSPRYQCQLVHEPIDKVNSFGTYDQCILQCQKNPISDYTLAGKIGEVPDPVHHRQARDHSIIPHYFSTTPGTQGTPKTPRTLSTPGDSSSQSPKTQNHFHSQKTVTVLKNIVFGIVIFLCIAIIIVSLIVIQRKTKYSQQNSNEY